MRISVPHDKMGDAARFLYDHDVSAALIERTGLGWIIELMQPVPNLAEKARQAGFKVLER